MDLVSVFNPIATLSGSFFASTIQTGSRMLIVNKSYVDILFTFSNGFTMLVIANDRRAVTFEGGSSVPNPTIQWAQQNIDYPQTVNQLENVVYVELYEPFEKIIETYPSNIVRETLPSLVPYNLGNTVFGLNKAVGLAIYNPVIWPSSYSGLAIAPHSPPFISGLGYNHFYYFQDLTKTVMSDAPGLYPTTGKTPNDATPNNKALMSYVPGPFSLAGLRAIDTATHVEGAHWALANPIPWANSTNGYLVEMWVNLDAVGNFQDLFGDGSPSDSNTGVHIFANPDRTISAEGGFVGGFKSVQGGLITPGKWQYIVMQYTGTTTNTLNLYINGVLIATNITSGSPVNDVHAPFIAGIAVFPGNTINASLAYVGILLSGPGTGQGSPQARFEHAQQSLNQDYQNAWITGIDYQAVGGATATNGTGQFSINNLLNTAGLLYTTTQFTQDALHTYNINFAGVVDTFPALAINSVYTRSFHFPTPVGHYNTDFPFVTVFVNGSVGIQSFDMLAYGYNILGVF